MPKVTQELATAAVSQDATEAKVQSDEAPRATAPSKDRSGLFRKIVGVGAFLLIVAGLGTGGMQSYKYLSSFAETDDAYATGHMHAVSSRIEGTVQSVLVDDNQHVKAGQVLATLDPRDLQMRVDEAQAALDTARHQATAARAAILLSSTNASGKSAEAAGNVSDSLATIEKLQAALPEAKARIAQAQAQLAQAKAEETRAQRDYERFQKLLTEGAVSAQQRDTAQRDLLVSSQARIAAAEVIQQSQAQFQQAQHAVSEARADLTKSRGLVEQAQALHVQTEVNASQFEVARAAIRRAETQLQDAQLQLSYTSIVAPITGRIGKKTVEVGQRIQGGQQLMYVVSDDLWVVANFKETQLEKMHKGQEVELKIDSFPGHKFSGTIDSFAPGSGSSFALLPADNATGNFTKIVQRIPVKILLDAASVKGYEDRLVPGMSAVVKVTLASGHNV